MDQRQLEEQFVQWLRERLCLPLVSYGRGALEQNAVSHRPGSPLHEVYASTGIVSPLRQFPGSVDNERALLVVGRHLPSERSSAQRADALNAGAFRALETLQTRYNGPILPLQNFSFGDSHLSDMLEPAILPPAPTTDLTFSAFTCVSQGTGSISANDIEEGTASAIATQMDTFEANERSNSPKDMPKSFQDVRKLLLFDKQWSGPFIPQAQYKHRNPASRRQMEQDVEMSGSLCFLRESSYGISLGKEFGGEVTSLLEGKQPVLQACGPSVSIRVLWPGYAPFSKQIASRDWCTPRKPITQSKLAQEVKKVLSIFMAENQGVDMDADPDAEWCLHRFTMEDLVLVSIHQVSQGSWQPQIRLRKPMGMPG